MNTVWQWIVAHWVTIAYVLGVWALVASLVNKSVWPKPAAPKWKVILHALLIDGPAFLPSINCKGILGLPVNVPFLTLSTVVTGNEVPPGNVLKGGKLDVFLPIAFAAAFGACVAGCNKQEAQLIATDIGAVAKECLEPAVLPLVVKILPAVVVALLSDNFAPALQALETQGGAAGPLVVECAVDVVRENAKPATGAELSPTSATLIQHANEWSSSHAHAK